MTCVIVNDASCLIDLRKGGLLGVVCDLPHRFVVPLPVRASEVLDLLEAEWQALDEAGMITHDLTPEEVGQALVVKECHPGLSANDCFCLVPQTYILASYSRVTRCCARFLREMDCGYTAYSGWSTSLRPRRFAADRF